MGRFTCLDCNKNSYQSWFKAHNVADIRSNDMITLHVYPCPHGRGFHLTKWPQKVDYS